MRFEDNEHSHIEGSTHGLVKLVADRDMGGLLGGDIVGEEAGRRSTRWSLKMIARAKAPAVARAIHAYPTLSGSVRGALLGIDAQVG